MDADILPRDPPFPFFVPHEAADGSTVEVAAPRARRDSPLAGMVGDVLGGELSAALALSDWLSDRRADPEYHRLWVRFEEALDEFLAMAIGRAERAQAALETVFAAADYAMTVAADWDHFRLRVRAIFVRHLWDVDDLVRFAAQVVRPGKWGVDTTGEG